jgi:VanZ family protein
MQRAVRIVFGIAVVFAFVMAVLPHPPSIPGQPSDKIMHALAFAVLGGLAAYAFPRLPIGMLLMGLTGFGALIEMIQAIPMLHRDSDIVDLIADIAAALAALAAMRWVMARQEHRP